MHHPIAPQTIFSAQSDLLTIDNTTGNILLSAKLCNALGVDSNEITTERFCHLFKVGYRQTAKNILCNLDSFVGASCDLKLAGARSVTFEVIDTDDCGRFICQITFEQGDEHTLSQNNSTIYISSQTSKRVYDNIMLGIELYDNIGRLVHINPLSMTMLGISSKQHIIGCNIFDDPNISEHVKTQLRRGQSVIFTGIYDFDLAKSHYQTTLSGSMYFKIRAAVVVENGQRQGYMITRADMTEKAQTDRQIYHKLELITKIYENLPVGVALFDKCGTMINTNRKLLEIFNVPSIQHALGYNLLEDQRLPEKIKEKVVHGDNFDFSAKYNFSATNGMFFADKRQAVETPTLTYRVAQLKNDNKDPDGFILIVTNDAEKQTKNAHKNEYVMLPALAEYARIGIARINLLSGETHASEQWYRNIRRTNGRPISDNEMRALVHPDDWIMMTEALHHILKGDVFSCRLEMRVGADKNQWMWIETFYKLTDFHPKEGVVYVHATNIDITERKVREQQLLIDKQKAEKNDKLKSAFLANMSHEICTPLNALLGFSMLLADKSQSDEDKEYVQIMISNHAHLLQIISDILDIAKIESGVLKFVFSEFQLSDLLQEIKHIYAFRNTGNVELRILPTQIDCSVVCDKVRLTQVITNFVNNAMQYTHSGHIHVGSIVRDGELELYVEDSGIGIAENRLPFIFDRFARINRYEPGSGIGLSICKSIMDQLGGAIGATSTEGKGSRFWIRLNNLKS